MIKKFSTNSLGCLRDLESPSLEKHVLVFGENGTGKSTIAAAIRAARDADVDAMVERAPLAGGSAEFQMTFEDETIEFSGEKWKNKNKLNIAVFDQAFVNQNIHSGDQLENEHKKKLYSIVLGDTCAGKLKEQAELAETILDHNRRVKDIQRDIEAKIPGNLEFGEFIKLEPVKNADSEIEKQAAVVDLFKKQAALNDAAEFEEIELPKASSSLAQTLSKTIDSISSDAEAKVKTHLQEHTDGASTRWIEDGLKHQQGDACPFCGTSTDANNLLESYKDFFSSSYADLKAEINSLSGLANSYFGESTMLKLQRRFDSNKNAGEFWKAYIDVPPLDHSVFEELTDELGECRDRTNKSIEQKQQNPLDEVSLGDISISGSLQERVDDYNTLVGVANKRIETVRESQKQADSDGQLQKLNRYKPPNFAIPTPSKNRLRSGKRRMSSRQNIVSAVRSSKNRLKKRRLRFLTVKAPRSIQCLKRCRPNSGWRLWKPTTAPSHLRFSCMSKSATPKSS